MKEGLAALNLPVWGWIGFSRRGRWDTILRSIHHVFTADRHKVERSRKQICSNAAKTSKSHMWTKTGLWKVVLFCSGSHSSDDISGWEAAEAAPPSGQVAHAQEPWKVLFSFPPLFSTRIHLPSTGEKENHPFLLLKRSFFPQHRSPFVMSQRDMIQFPGEWTPPREI